LGTFHKRSDRIILSTKPAETLNWTMQFIHQVAVDNQIGFLPNSTLLSENGLSSPLFDDVEGDEHHETFYGLVVNHIRLTAVNNPSLFKAIFVQYLSNPFLIIYRGY
jgi:hypothetical protein